MAGGGVTLAGRAFTVAGESTVMYVVGASVDVHRTIKCPLDSDAPFQRDSLGSRASAAEPSESAETKLTSAPPSRCAQACADGSG